MGRSPCRWTQPLGTVLRHTRLEPPERRLDRALEDAAALFRRRLGPVQRAAASTGYAAAGRSTVADISVGFALDFAARLSLSDLLPSDIRLYADRLLTRPAILQALAGDQRSIGPEGSPS